MTQCPLCKNRDGLLADSEARCKKANVQSLCATCTDIAAIDIQITETKNKLCQLQIERLKLLPDGNRSHDILTSSLPVEICAKIFLESLPDIEALDNKSHPRLLSAPLILSWVCRRWREILLGTPDMWAQMALSLKTTQQLGNVQTLVTEWLERGGNIRPLSIMISIDPLFVDSHEQSSSIINAIMDRIAQQSHRFVFFSIAATAQHMNYLSLQQHCAANLQSLRLIGLTVKGTREGIWLCDPKPRPTFLTLRNLRWNQLLETRSTSNAPNSITSNAPNILIDLSVLNTLTAAQLELEDCIELFKLAPSIKTCTISWLGEFTSTGAFECYRIRRWPNLPPPVVYKTLEELTFLDLTTEHCQFILSAFDFPSLRTFISKEESRRYGQTYGMIHSLTNHIKRAGAGLVSIHLHNLRCHGDIKSVMEGLMSVAGPTLVDFIVEHINAMHENPLQVIKGIFGVPSRLPELREIRIYSPANKWMQSLRDLAASAHKLAIFNQHPLSVTLSTTPEFYNDGSFKDVLNRDEVLDILDAVGSGLIIPLLLQGRLTEGPWMPDEDVTTDIMTALSGVGNKI